MASGVASPDEQSSGWDLEFKLSDWFRELIPRKGDHMGKAVDPDKKQLVDRFDTVGWGLLFLLFGALARPHGTAEYASAAAVGAAMLGLNGVRIAVGVQVRWFSVILGAAVLVAGSGALVSMHMDAFVLFFVIAGAVTIGGAILGPRRAPAQSAENRRQTARSCRIHIRTPRSKTITRPAARMTRFEACPHGLRARSSRDCPPQGLLPRFGCISLEQSLANACPMLS